MPNVSSASELLLGMINLEGLSFSMSGIDISRWGLIYWLLPSSILGISIPETRYWLMGIFVVRNAERLCWSLLPKQPDHSEASSFRKYNTICPP